jgi:hypothetical protein
VKQIPGAKTDAIWPALKALGKERNLIGHGVWMWTHFMKRATVLMNTQVAEAGGTAVRSHRAPSPDGSAVYPAVYPSRKTGAFERYLTSVSY